jgi:hypothetical protein
MFPYWCASSLIRSQDRVSPSVDRWTPVLPSMVSTA